MRLRNAAHADGAADDEVFMNFAPGGHNEHGDSNDLPTDHGASTYEDPLEDVFGSAPASPTLDRSNVDTGVVTERREGTDPSDIPRLRSVHVTNGYREGLSASKEQYVQAGFDEGYSLGAELGMKVGWLIGVLQGVVRAIPSGSEGKEGGGKAMSRNEVRDLLAEAEEEMSMKKLFGGEYFGGDGVWIYSVPAAEREGEEEVTFKEIADAHPVVVKWEGTVRQLAERAGLRIG